MHNKLSVEHTLAQDTTLNTLINSEFERQSSQICLIASENIVSQAVLQAQGSVLTNKYAEGYPEKRYYEGCQVCDKVEQLAIDRACELFNVKYANVQPHSGSQANQAVFLACLEPGDTILGMDLSSGGHLTHGFKNNLSGLYYNSISYSVDTHTLTIDYEQLRNLALEHKPKLIIAGGSSYPRLIDWAKIRVIADEVGALFLADIAHTAGLIAGQVLESPAKYADILTCTTHKTLRGPRGGLILTNNEELIKKINRAIMPGIQGGPMLHTIAAKAASFYEDLMPEFRHYAHNVLVNAKAMADTFVKRGIKLTTNGTDTHLMVLDVSTLNKTGHEIAKLLAEHNIITNKNAIPYDTLGVIKTSGIRIGTPFITTCGFTVSDCVLLANYISDLILSSTTHASSKESTNHTTATTSKLHPEYGPFSDLFAKVRATYTQLKPL